MKSRLKGVFERPAGSGVWWINYRDSAGKRHREKVGRRSVAEKAYLQRQIEIREGRFAAPRPDPGPTFRELAAERMAWAKGRLKPASYRTDRIRLGPLLLAFGDLPVEEVTPIRISKFLDAIIERGRRPATANRYLWLMRAVFSLALKHDRIAKNPCSKVPNFKEDPGRIRFLTAEEELRLRAAIRENCPEREPEFDLALHTGMRRGEQFGLKWENVDVERGILTVTGKTGRRHVHVNSVARAALHELFKRRFPRGLEWNDVESGRLSAARSAFVCEEVKRDGQPDWRRWLEMCVRKAQVPNFRWHDLRHTFASRLVMAGVDIRGVQELLGHKSITMTMKYAHLSRAHLDAAIEKLVPTGTSAAQPS